MGRDACPRTLVRTAPGWSCVVDGIPGRGYEVMRGVIRTDQFAATPAVFALHGPGRIKIARGTPLIRVTPLPRALLGGEPAIERLDGALALR